MNRNPAALSKTIFDVVVIGGGINGAATARDAAMRGLKVALVEAQDFASGTSSRSSKLIHGGLRYLDRLEFGLVREARQERRRLLRLAPHLARSLPFLLPIYKKDPYSRSKVRLGLSIYDLLGHFGSSDSHRMLKRDELLEIIPALEPHGLVAGALFYDSEADDARLTLENVLDATAHGALVANYTAVRRFLTASGDGSRAPEISGAEIEDRLSGRHYQIQARYWVNATGPWVDRVRALLPGYDGTKSVRLTKGTHVIVPAVSREFAIFGAILPGRRIFVLAPWHGHALLGTTDTDFADDPNQVIPLREEIEYLLSAINRVLRRPLGIGEVIGAFAGVRALAIESGASPSENTREYRFRQDPWASNFISVCGGKLTTARALAEKLVDRLIVNLGDTVPGAKRAHPTRTAPFPGAKVPDFWGYFQAALKEAGSRFDVSPRQAERIVRTYGTRWEQVLEPIRSDRQLAEPLSPGADILAAEVVFAIRHEMAAKPEDFLLRRSGLNWYAPCELRDAVAGTARIFAEQFGWDTQQQNVAIEEYRRLAYPCSW